MQYNTEMLCECYKETENYCCKTTFCKTKLKFYKRRTTTIFGISGKMKDYLQISHVIRSCYRYTSLAESLERGGCIQQLIPVKNDANFCIFCCSCLKSIACVFGHENG